MALLANMLFADFRTEYNLDFDALEISDDDSSYTTDFKQIGKRKDRSSDLNRSFKVSSPDYREAGLEEASAPDHLKSRRPKRRSNARKNLLGLVR